MSNLKQDSTYIERMYGEVHEELSAQGIKHRRWKVDGEHRLLTRDVNLDRLNFETDNEVITEVHRG